MNFKKQHNDWQGLVFLVILFLLLAFGFQSAGQYNLRPNITHFSRQSYKASEKNWAVDIDSLGYVYFGNNRGLLQYDGERWELYQLPGKTIIRSVKIGPDNKIYTGSFEEFGYWERDSIGMLHYVSLSQDIAAQMHNDEFWKIGFDGHKVVFQSFANIFLYEEGKITKIQEQLLLLFLQESNKQLFIQGVTRGLFTIRNNLLNFIPGSELFNDKLVRTIMPLNPSENLICSAHDGIFIHHKDQFTYWDTPISAALKGADVNAGVVINDHVFAIGTLLKGIFIFDSNGEILRQITVEDELGSKSVYDLNIDNVGNLWVGLDKGISLVRFDTPVKLFIDKTQSMGLVYDVCEHNQRIYVATNRGLFTSTIDHHFPESFKLSGLKQIDELDGQVWDLEIIDDMVFCGHSNGTFILEGDRAIRVSDYNGAQKIRELMNNNQKYLIQSTYANLILYARDKITRQWKASYAIKGFLEPSKNIEVDELGNIWVSHMQKGIYKLTLSDDLTEVSHSRYFDREAGLPVHHNLNIFKVKSHIVITTGYGLYAFDNLRSEIVPFYFYNNQLDEFQNAKSIFQVNENDYWFILDEMAALYRISNDTIVKLKQVSFDFNDAVLVEYYENITPISHQYSVACLTNGLGVISNQKEEKLWDERAPVITRIEVFNKNAGSRYLPLHEGNETFIQPRETRMTFNFTGFNYNEGPNIYKTRLLEIEREWTVSTLPQRSFERLPQGEYTFEVGTVTNNGSQMPTSAYTFTVMPPWYQSRAAYILYIVLFISLVVAVRIYVVLKLKKQIDQIRQNQKVESEKEQQLYHQRIVELENEKLQSEIEFKSQQLAALTMNTINKNELLSGIRKLVDKQMDELGSRFPKKNYQEIMNAIDKYLTDDDWETFEFNFDRAHQDFFNRLKIQFPDLTPGDIKICAYLKMNLSSKEIAHLLNISIRSVEVHRYRIRKKLKLQSTENLVEYLMAY
jgi:DNA-binding CsgD family transcriptional regulator/ligand-binding sensor domain-containing protein